MESLPFEKAEITVFTSNFNLKRRVARSIASTGATIHHVMLELNAIEKTLEKNCHMFIVDTDNESELTLWLLRELARKHNDSIKHMLYSNMESRILVGM